MMLLVVVVMVLLLLLLVGLGARRAADGAAACRSRWHRQLAIGREFDAMRGASCLRRATATSSSSTATGRSSRRTCWCPTRSAASGSAAK